MSTFSAYSIESRAVPELVDQYSVFAGQVGSQFDILDEVAAQQIPHVRFKQNSSPYFESPVKLEIPNGLSRGTRAFYYIDPFFSRLQVVKPAERDRLQYISGIDVAKPWDGGVKRIACWYAEKYQYQEDAMCRPHDWLLFEMLPPQIQGQRPHILSSHPHPNIESDTKKFLDGFVQLSATLQSRIEFLRMCVGVRDQSAIPSLLDPSFFPEE